MTFSHAKGSFRRLNQPFEPVPPGKQIHPESAPLDQDTYDRKIRWIADRLGEIRADLIGFQEVWSTEALADCFRAAGLEQKYRLIARDGPPGLVQVARVVLAAQPPQKLFVASTAGNKSTKAGDVGLYSAQMLQEFRSLRDVYYTYIHENVMESLDHVFMSEEFYDHSPSRIWTFRELKVLNDHIHFRSQTDKVRSDHGIVVARFDAVKAAPDPGPPA